MGIAALGKAQCVHLLGTGLGPKSCEAQTLGAAGFALRFHRHVDELVEAVAADATAACALADLCDDGAGADDLLADLATAQLFLPVIYVGSNASLADVLHRLKSGAVDYLLRPVAPETLVAAVNGAAMMAATYRQALPPAAAIPGRLARLTCREREVLLLLVRGLSTKEIGRELGVSPRTVEVHRSRLLNKMQARNGVHLVRMVMGAGRATTPTALPVG